MQRLRPSLYPEMALDQRLAQLVELMRKQLTIIGSWTFSKIGQVECASFVADRKIAVEHLFTHRWRLAQAEDAYRVFNQQASGKGVFVMP